MNPVVFLAQEGEEMNPLIPAWPEVIIGLLCFFIVFGILGKKLLPSIEKVLADRRDAIEGGMERAEATQAEAQALLEQYRAELAEARHEAARIIEQAREQGAAQLAEMREEGQRQREAIVAAGHAQIDADKRQATAALRQDVGSLATQLASRIVGESLEDHARQSGVVDRFLAELEAKATVAQGAAK
ncbi:F0F1 ATP synthase subunit B [Kitasatospora sp. NPDC058032]|uniref:F0F1 ATP synthase subunit B n=1 Tax=Kitasatospora sp. NPDC058032 TaxID=3346307 RepID=UPI0036DB48B7